jgi:hypothetical protein
MEPDFISELDKTLSNVGTDIFWKRRVGALELWISPLSVTGQEKVTTTISKAELGTNIVGESKRVTLANAIVGVNDSDLREYRGGTPIFPMRNKKGEVVKTRLEEWLYDKMARWSAQYLDDAFAVYADLMETYQKENLKEVKFENAKDPHMELQELEQRVSNLRSQLGMSQLIEKNEDEESLPDPEEIAEALERERQEDEKEKNPPAEDFNPFRPINKPEEVSPQAAQPPQPPPQPFVPPPSGPPQPSMTMPAVLPANLRRPMPAGHQAQESSPERPHTATPSVPNDVIEKPLAQRGVPQERPKVDQPQGGRNPRFQPPPR